MSLLFTRKIHHFHDLLDDTMSSHHGQYSPGRGLSPNAMELGRQIAVARQLMQKQKQAEFRSNAFFEKRSSMRPAAHILPMKKDDYKSGKIDTYLSLEEDYDLDEDVSLHKSGAEINRSVYSGFNTSRSNRNLQSSRLDSTSKTGDELLEKWKTQSEVRKLEGRLQEKTKEVADLQTQVNQTLQVAQDKERNIANMRAVWDETASKQSVARQRLRHYIDDLADRAERAEKEVEDLRTSLTLSRTGSLSRTSERSQVPIIPNRHNPINSYPTKDAYGLSDIMQHQYSSLERRGLPRNPPGTYRDMYSHLDQEQNANASRVDPGHPPSRYSHEVEAPIDASDVQLASHIPHLPTPFNKSVRNAPHETSSAVMLQGMSSSFPGGKGPYEIPSPSLLPGTSSYIPTAPSDRDAIFKDQNNWEDMDFLEEVMEDVMLRRSDEQRNGRLENPGPSPTAVSRGFSPLPSYGVDYSRNSPKMYQGESSRVANEDSESEVSVTSVSQWSEEGKIQHKTGTFLHHLAPKKRRALLFLVFSYLNTSSRLKCASVCREWRDVSRQPELWQVVHLRGRQISSKFLKTIATWCTQLKWLTLEKLSPRKQREGETRENYLKIIRGCLEPGLEVLLQSVGNNLLTFKVVDCPHIFTERVLWLASCHGRSLMSVTYISKTDPVGAEVIWALGAGCRHIQSLKIPPRHPCEKPKRFNSACVAMIGRCWNQLKALSVGGPHTKPESLTIVIRSCVKLQVLELDHMTKITEEKAVELCRHGLRGLHTLILKHTPITPSAIIHFNGACPQLTRISIHLSLSDFFPPPASPGQRKEFSKAIETILVLGKKRSLENTLQIRADYK